MTERIQVRLKVPALETEEGAGARVRRVFPTLHLPHLDPFILLDEFYVTPPAGFPDHPHRGFEAVTYMLEGAFHHRDNLGNDRIVPAGGVQRFTAGRGLIHAELPGTPNLNRGLQLWINLPRRLKAVAPDYQQVEPSAIPERKIGGARTRIVVGQDSPVQLHTPMRYLDIALEAGASFEDEILPEWNALVYVLEGRLRLDELELILSEAAVIEPGGKVTAVAVALARFVLLTGKPHGEPIHQHGPLVD